jgi:hypothetical protein
VIKAFLGDVGIAIMYVFTPGRSRKMRSGGVGEMERR